MENLLDHIETPRDLRKLGIEQLPQVCKELRDFIIDESSRNPGHFGASPTPFATEVNPSCTACSTFFVPR